MKHPAWPAFLRRDWGIARSYRFPFLLGVISNLLAVAIFYYLSSIVRTSELPANAGRSQGYFAFAIVGIVVFDLLVIGVVGAARRTREELLSGTLELLAAAPLPQWLIAAGGASYDMIYGVITGAVVLVAAVVIFGAEFALHASAVPAVILATLATIALVAALAMAVAAVTVVVKQAATVAGLLTTVLAIISGVYYPLTVLPNALQAIAWASPLRWSLDVLRPALFGHAVPTAELAATVAAGVIALPLAATLYEAALRRARRAGSLAQY
jgi:ABC-2 type transport system permease protein